MSAANRPLAISLGDPGGIGLQLLLGLRASLGAERLPPTVLYAPPQLVRKRAARWRLKLELIEVSSPAEAAAVFSRGLPIIPTEAEAEEEYSGTAAVDSSVVVESLTKAVTAAASGEASGVVTLPLAKRSLPKDFCGQTEFCASISKTPVAMMLLNRRLRTVVATTHIPLAAVAAALNKEMLVEKGLIAVAALRGDFAVAVPRLAVAGLNPHAGENGLLGDEEEKIIAPAIAELRERLGDTAEIIGPMPADTMFAVAKNYDAALCMYHDQALIAVKGGGDFDSSVNVSLGLRFVRTSPAHGTAFALAARELGDYAGLQSALRLAAAIAERRHDAACS